jgi:hypothetical protein
MARLGRSQRIAGNEPATLDFDGSHRVEVAPLDLAEAQHAHDPVQQVVPEVDHLWSRFQEPDFDKIY